MKIAITGATGFIGKNLLERLSKEKIKPYFFNTKKHDLLDRETLEDFVKDRDVIIHLAGVNKESDILNLFKTNVLGTSNLLQAIEKFNPQAKLIFSSSIMVNSRSSLYGISKKLAEMEIESFSKNNGLKGIILRFSNIYGNNGIPFKNSVIHTFLMQAKKNERLTVIGEGYQKRDYLFVDDAIDALMKAIYLKVKKVEVFDICTGKETSINDLVKTLGLLMQKKLLTRNIKGIEEEATKFRLNYKKALSTFGWIPKYDLKSGLKRCL